MRGIWLCTKNRNPSLLNRYDAPNSKWATKTHAERPQGCGRWQVYVSKKERGKWDFIDVRCKNCNRRVKFQPYRRDGRGRPRPIRFKERPEHMPYRALLKEVRARNNLEELEEAHQGFVKASAL